MPKAKPNPEQLIEQLEAMTVLELNDLVKQLQDRWEVQPMALAAPVGGVLGAPTATEAEAEEQSIFDVILSGFASDKKIQVIKAVREVTNLGLKDAKDLVEGAPKSVKEGATKEEAQGMKEKLEAAGGTVELK